MQKERNLQHWNDWAQKFGTDLRSTTKCQSIKQLEIAALSRKIAGLDKEPLRVLEVGCGNGRLRASLYYVKHPQLHDEVGRLPEEIVRKVPSTIWPGTGKRPRDQPARSIVDWIDEYGPHSLFG